MSKILVIAAHPDDGVLGCGGTMARLEKEGHKIDSLTLGKGRGGEYDNKFDKMPLFHWVQIIEEDGLDCNKKLDGFKPDIIFTHYEKDLNKDHRITYQAVLTATRPQPGCSVREIYSFEVLSSTEWSFPTSFSPDVFYELTEEQLHTKRKLLRDMHYDEMRAFPHPRSQMGVEYLARVRGMAAGVKYAEAFKIVRIIRRNNGMEL